MPDQRSVLKEFRLLDQKRKGEGLSPREEARYAQLRELVAPETGAGPARGFDVNAAAVRLRESLLPAGLRNRPVPVAEAAPAPEPEPPVEPSRALETMFGENQFSSLSPEASLEPAADAFFDPASLADTSSASLGDAQAYDPGAQVYDPNAAAGYDPNAPAYDPNAPGDYYDPNAAGVYDPNAPAYDPNAPADYYDPNAAGAYDPNAPAYDPNAPADYYDPNAAGHYDPNAADPNAPAYDPNAADAFFDPASLADTSSAGHGEAQAYDPGAQGQDPNAAYDPGSPASDSGAGGADSNAAWELDAERDGVVFEPNASDAPSDGAASQDAAEADRMARLEMEPDAEGAFPSAPPEPAEQENAAPAWDARAEDAAPVDQDRSALGLESSATSGAEEAETQFYDASAAAALPPAYDSAAWDSGEAGMPGDAEPMAATEPQAAEPPAGESSWADPSSEPWAGAPPSDDAALLAPEGWDAAEPPPEPSAAPFGEYDQTEAPAPGALESMLSFGPGGEAAIEPGQVPEGGGDAPLFEPEAGIPPPSGHGDHDDAGGLEAPPPDPSAIQDEFVASQALERGSGADWQREVALDQDFALESNGSFGADALFTPDVPRLDLGETMTPSQPPFPEDGSDIPLIEGEGILEEIPSEPDAPLPSFDFEGGPPRAEPENPFVLPGGEDDLAPTPVEAALELDFDVAEEPAPSPFGSANDAHVAGEYQVVVHTVGGLMKRGVLKDADLDALAIGLSPQPGGALEIIRTEEVKAIFFVLGAGERPLAPEGKKVRITFRDGEQLSGFSSDYQEGGIGFFVVPEDTRMTTGRIWVYQGAVQQVTVD